MKLRFAWIAWFLAVFLWLLAVALIAVPGPLFASWGFELDSAGRLLSWRSAALYAGFGLFVFFIRNLPPSPLRGGIAAAVAVASGGLGVANVIACLLGVANTPAVIAIGVFELIVAAVFVLVERFEPAARAERHSARRRSSAAPDPNSNPREA